MGPISRTRSRLWSIISARATSILSSMEVRPTAAPMSFAAVRKFSRVGESDFQNTTSRQKAGCGSWLARCRERWCAVEYAGYLVQAENYQIGTDGGRGRRNR